VVRCRNADVAELADAPDLGSGSERSEGSSPFIRIKFFLSPESAIWERSLVQAFDPYLLRSIDRT
jgi:hypothetical protein